MTRHLWKANKERANKRRLTSWAKKVYARRKETDECADAVPDGGSASAEYEKDSAASVALSFMGAIQRTGRACEKNERSSKSG